MKAANVIVGVLCGVVLAGFAHEPSHALFLYYSGLKIVGYSPLQEVYFIANSNTPNYVIALSAAAPYLLSMFVGLLTVIFNRNSLFWRGFSLPLVFQSIPSFFISSFEPINGFHMNNGDWLVIQSCGFAYSFMFVYISVSFALSWLLLIMLRR